MIPKQKHLSNKVPDDEQQEQQQEPIVVVIPPRCVVRHFSRRMSTEQLYSVDTTSIEQQNNNHHPSSLVEDYYFDGPYGEFRRTKIDYTYHAHYCKERQWVQDAIIQDFLPSSVVGTGGESSTTTTSTTTTGTKWIIFTVGAPGAGKRHVWKYLLQHQLVVLPQQQQQQHDTNNNDGRTNFVHLDRQEIRRRLPEFGCYNNNNDECSSNNEEQDAATGKEAGCIMELIVHAALERKDVEWIVMDTSLRDATWHESWLTSLRKQTSSDVKTALWHVTASRDTILQRGEKIAKFSRRQISAAKIDAMLEQIPHSIQHLTPQMDYVCEFDNDDTTNNGAVQLVSSSLNNNNNDWSTFTQLFSSSSSITAAAAATISQQQQVTTTTTPTTKVQTPVLSKFVQVYLSRIWNTTIPKSIPSPTTTTLASSPSQQQKAEDPKKQQQPILFYGKYTHLRATLDYTFHETHYSESRQCLQDRIIDSFLESPQIVDQYGQTCRVPTEPWIVFTAGAMGAGKSYTMKQLVLRQNRFPLLAFVMVDPDEVRRHLPEYAALICDDPLEAGHRTRKEAGLICETLTLAALEAGTNVLVDGSLRDAEWYSRYLRGLRRSFPNVRQAIIHITASPSVVLERAERRGRETGRVIPRDLLLATLEQVPRSVERLTPLVDYVCEIRNDSTNRHTTNNNGYENNNNDVELTKPEGSTWQEFSQQWIQTCRYTPPLSASKQNNKNESSSTTEAVVQQRMPSSSVAIPI
eukprot:CAMPEP_0194240102 /NCGR_PEP_ID=MMETSP0158-20130606/6377_1 /TAXON_ID=33649 /ORGANISM="Thalassionema nitzschioides, Strain L26-B" /LENGTH=746 /DNA_ID=CAMNT_0038974741 /DNA_START=99 /DNA_END=2339 /DNA_ORIENTATION=-